MTTISLKKGETLALDQISPTLNQASIGLRWDPNPDLITDQFDLDLSAFLLGENNQLLSNEHLIFYNNLNSPDLNQSVQLIQDNRTGIGEGDDEIMTINFSTLPHQIFKIALCVTIHQAQERHQDFGQIQNTHLRLVNLDNHQEILRYNLAEDFSLETAIIIAEFYRQDTSNWSFTALGSPYQGGFPALIQYYQ